MRYLACVLWTLCAVVSGFSQQQLLLIQRNWSSMPTFYRDCMQVSSDGSYRFEHSGVSMQEPEFDQIHVGKFSDEEMKQLQAILEEPSLQALSTPGLNPGGMTMGSDIDTFWIAIYRGNHPQVMFFDSTSSTGSKYASEHLPSLYRTAAMKPLVNWYKQMAKRKNDVDKTARPACAFQVQYQQQR